MRDRETADVRSTTVTDAAGDRAGPSTGRQRRRRRRPRSLLRSRGPTPYRLTDDRLTDYRRSIRHQPIAMRGASLQRVRHRRVVSAGTGELVAPVVHDPPHPRLPWALQHGDDVHVRAPVPDPAPPAARG